MNLTNKVVIITGASSGIGKACVTEFFNAGANIVLASRNEMALCAVADSVDPSGRRTLVVPTNVAVESDCKKLIDETLSYFGRIDVLINNAGLSMRASFSDLNIDVLEQLMNVNFWGTVYCTKYAMPYLLQSRGTIVGVTSVAAHIGLPYRTGYSASKFAMRGFLETIRNEYLHAGVNVFIVAPSFTSSNIRYSALTADGTPQGFSPRNEKKMMSAESVAMVIRKGVQRNRRFRTLGFIYGKLSLFLNKLCPVGVSWFVNRKMQKEMQKSSIQ